MTIEIQGHVDGLRISGGDVIVTLRLEASRALEPLELNASRAETTGYYPGMPIRLIVQPLAKARGES